MLVLFGFSIRVRIAKVKPVSFCSFDAGAPLKSNPESRSEPARGRNINKMHVI